MNKEEQIKYLEDFLNGKDGFFYELIENGVFEKREFHRYTSIIYDLSQIKISDQDKYQIAILIWEISLKIERLLGSSKDSNSLINISNLEGDDIYQISEILFYTSNWFSYNKTMEKKNLIIGSWF